MKLNACAPFLSDTALVYVQPNAEQGHQYVCHFGLSPWCTLYSNRFAILNIVIPVRDDISLNR